MTSNFNLNNDQIKHIITMVIVLIWLIMFLTSCGGNYHARRIDHHMKKLKAKNPELIQPLVKVTTDTIYIPDIQKDTVVKYKFDVRDSIIFKDKTKVRYLIKHDTIQLDVDCPDQIVKTDSVFIKDVVTVPETFVSKAKSLWYLLLIGFVLGIVAVVLVRR